MKKFLMQEPALVQSPAGHRFTILRNFCKGCRICVAFCPTQVLGLDDRFKVAVLHPERCIGCRLCELRCPDIAIHIARGSVRKAGKAAAPVSRSGEK